LGRRLDDARSAASLPAVGYVRLGFRVRGVAGKITLVYAVALRTLARNEPGYRVQMSSLDRNGKLLI
jgi:hypothetical protein